MFENFIGKKIKVIFEDIDSKGNPNKVIFGVLISVSDGFLNLKMEDGSVYSVNTSKVVAIKNFGKKDHC